MRITLRRRRVVTAAVLVAAAIGLAAGAGLAAQSAASAGANWPQFRGPNRDNLSTDTGLLKQWDADGPSLAWKASGLGIGFSSLAITKDRIYTMGDQGTSQYVIALAAADGKVLWKTKVGPNWDDRYPGPRATPTVDGALLYTIGTEGDVVCLETATGKERWRKSLVTRLRRADHVGLEIQRVAAGRRRSRRRHAGRQGQRDCRPRQADRGDRVEGRDARPRPERARRRRLRLDRDLERRRREAVRARCSGAA